MSDFFETPGVDPVEVEIEVTGDLNFAAAEQLQKTLLNAIPEQGTLRVTLREINNLDLAGIQLLYSLCRTAASRNVTIEMIPGEAAPRLEKLVQFTGLTPIPRVKP